MEWMIFSISMIYMYIITKLENLFFDVLYVLMILATRGFNSKY